MGLAVPRHVSAIWLVPSPVTMLTGAVPVQPPGLEQHALSHSQVDTACVCTHVEVSISAINPSLPPDPPDPPIWAAGIGVVVLLLIAVVIIILVIALLYWKRKHKKKGLSRVQPSGEGSRENLQLLKVDPTPGTPGSNDAIDDELNFTRTSSLTVIIPKGVCGWRADTFFMQCVGVGWDTLTYIPALCPRSKDP